MWLSAFLWPKHQLYQSIERWKSGASASGHDWEFLAKSLDVGSTIIVLVLRRQTILVEWLSINYLIHSVLRRCYTRDGHLESTHNLHLLSFFYGWQNPNRLEFFPSEIAEIRELFHVLFSHLFWVICLFTYHSGKYIKRISTPVHLKKSCHSHNLYYTLMPSVVSRFESPYPRLRLYC